MREGGKLFFNSTGGSKRMELFAESESTFFLKVRPYVFVFTTAEGQAPQLKIVEGAAPSCRRGSSSDQFEA
jgi:hypothetical protein